jgi:hypothetical protein
MMCCDVLVVVLPHWSVAVRLMCEADSARDDPRDHQRQSEWPVEVPHRPVRSGSLCGECCTVDDVPYRVCSLAPSIFFLFMLTLRFVYL